MRFALIALTVGFTILLCFTNNRTETCYLEAENIVVTNAPVSKVDQIEKINRRNSKVKSVCFEHVVITTSANKLLSLSSAIVYEKPKNFRMLTRSKFGLESDVGSNEDNFWFWSKRLNPPYLYYSSYENLENSRLKITFNPLWLIDFLGVNEINYKNTNVFKQNNLIGIIETKSNAYENVAKITLIDPDKSAVIGHYIINKVGKIIASNEITEFQEVDGILLPKTVQSYLEEEDLKVTWELTNPKVNIAINDQAWEMPDMSKKLDISN